jgi:hypothetical protein
MLSLRLKYFIRILLTPVLLASVFVFQSNILLAQNTGKDSILNPNENIKPQMNDHQFITTTLVDGPFANTYFSLSAGVGSSSNYDYPLVINGQEVQGLFGQITYVALDVRYQQNIKDWLAFLVTVRMKGRLGSQTISILTEGVNIGNSFNIGWLFKAFESRKLMLSAGLNLSTVSVTTLNFTDFVEKVIENGGITPDNKLIKTTNNTLGTVGLRGAYAFNRTFGCIANLNSGYGESVSGVNRGYFDAGISFDANLDPNFSVPIGLAIGYSWNNYSQADISFSNPQNIIFKINYTGRKDFDLGAEVNAQFFTLDKLNQSIDMQVLFMKASIAYYF